MPPPNNLPAKFRSPALAKKDADLGPAMLKLNSRQRAFVDYLVTFGCKPGDFTEAYRAAGYEACDGALRVGAHRLIHSDPIQAAIREEMDRRAVAVLPMALGTMIKIAGDPQHKDAAKTAKDLAALAGMSPINRSEVKVKHEGLSLPDQLREHCRQAGIVYEDFLRFGKLVDITPETDWVELNDL